MLANQMQTMDNSILEKIIASCTEKNYEQVKLAVELERKVLLDEVLHIHERHEAVERKRTGEFMCRL